VRIPIPDLLISLRTQAQGNSATPLRGAGSGRKLLPALAFKAWSFLYASPLVYRAFSFMATRFRALTPSSQGAWTRSRVPLKPARHSLHSRMREIDRDRK
jgi:L-lactate dehydrogenase complex protein LldF